MFSDAPEAAEAPEPIDDEPAPESGSLPIVGIGASAGGLEAVRELLGHLPSDTGMAFVLVQHLDPQHESALAEILSRATAMPVTEIEHGMTIEADHIYIIPPNAYLTICDGVLELAPRSDAPARHMPVDLFLNSLARAARGRAIAIILSGTASDGALGVSSVKAEGGITFAQDQSAKYDGMPRAAVATGHVDLILPPQGIAEEIARISRHPYIANLETLVRDLSPSAQGRELKTIYQFLRSAKGVDFSLYKKGTLERRIRRRMAVHRIHELEDYVVYLQSDGRELEALYQDILISVTEFFRDPETFEALKSVVFARLLENRATDEPIRIWVPGCSTGEEVYSIAVCLVEFLEGLEAKNSFKIFATDISDAAIARGRSGVYPENISMQVSADRLRRFFASVAGGYQISKIIRDSCIFARQDLTRDPPFSQIDFISCRNVLIYFGPELQKRVIPILHYSLLPTGYLMLGSSETIGQFSDLFRLVDRRFRIYAREPGPARRTFEFTTGPHVAERDPGTSLARGRAASVVDIQREADRLALERYAPSGVIITSDREIIQFRGETGSYLEPAAGVPSLDVLKMAREGLLVQLRIAIEEALERDVTVRKQGLRVRASGHFVDVNIEVTPLDLRHGGRPCLLVSFETPAAKARDRHGEKTASVWARMLSLLGRRSRADDTSEPGETERAPDSDGDLRKEIDETRDFLQSTIEEHDAKNEELKAANEEILSSNEELQSTNEELETAKEELQAANEELTTLNDELKSRNAEAARTNDDLTNLLSSVNIPILMLDPDLRIRKFTPSAARMLSLIPSDVGRPISDIRPKISGADLEQRIPEVLANLTVSEDLVQDLGGRWHTMTVRPYRTLDNRIDGAVVTLVDVDRIKRSEERTRKDKLRTRAILESAAEGIIAIDGHGTVDLFNAAAERIFGYSAADVVGQNIEALIPDLQVERQAGDVESSQQRGMLGSERDVEGLREDGSRFPLHLSVSEVEVEGEWFLTGVIRDLSGLKESEERVMQAERLAAIGETMTALAHESRNALQRAQAGLERLGRRLVGNEEATSFIRKIQAAQDDLHRLYECVKNYAVPVRPKPEPCDLAALLEDVWRDLHPAREGRETRLEQHRGTLDLFVRVDRAQFGQVLRNILENSLAASSGVVEIDVSYSESVLSGMPALRMAIRDNGPGLTPENRERIFDAFYTTRTHGSTGLGMAIARRIVEAHGGRIAVGSSDAPGAEIVITLPHPGRSA